MRPLVGLTAQVTVLMLVLVLASSLHAAPLVPTSDAQVLLQLDGTTPERAQQRRWQQQLRTQPQHEPTALRLAGHWLAQARQQGDARFAGRALAVLAPVPDSAAVRTLRATVLQHLHRFDEAVAQLDPPAGPQAWLLLASVRRTQGRLADSDAACAGLARSGAALHAAACTQENAGLRAPKQGLQRWTALLASPKLDAATQAWLLVSQADQQLRAAQAPAAEQSLRQALRLQDDAYARIQLADLLAPKRAAEALALLQPLPRSDAVAVRLALLGERLRHPQATAWVQDVESRFAQAAERQAAAPQEPIAHGREQALWLLPRQPAAALQAAMANVQQQREPIDLLLLAQAVKAVKAAKTINAADQAAALRQLALLTEQTGIQDERLAPLLR